MRRVSRALATAARSSLFDPLDTFPDRHIGPNVTETQEMLKKVGYDSMEDFVAASVPPSIRLPEAAVSNEGIPALSETDLLKRAKSLAATNKPFKSYIGMGYHNAVVPPVILRNVCSTSPSMLGLLLKFSEPKVIENPAWYTPYTPYQPEIAQGKPPHDVKLHIC